MQTTLLYLSEIAKYVLAVIFCLYSITGIYSFRYQRESKRKYIASFQTILIFISQLFMFLQIIMTSNDTGYFFYYLFIQSFLLIALTMLPLIYDSVHKVLLNHTCMLLGIGLCMISRLNQQKAIKQYIIVIISFMICSCIPFLLIKTKIWKKLTWFYGLFGVSILSVVLVFGEFTHGSKISFQIGGISFQPSEFIKIVFLFFLAGALYECTSFYQVCLTAIVAGLHVIILVLSTDLGSALIFFVGYVLVVFLATGNYLYLMSGILGGGVAAYIAYTLFDHVQIRVMAWLDPWKYIDNQGFQITQSLFSIGCGSWFGMGLFKGNPKAIPYVDADFIFSSICEELGVIAGICIICICLECFVIMMQLSTRISDRFYQIIIYGIAVMYIFQIFLTVGGGVKFIPLTGVTLPFISYGGSSVMTSMIMFFIIQGIYIRSQQEGGR